jgi:hypothetical protein
VHHNSSLAQLQCSADDGTSTGVIATLPAKTTCTQIHCSCALLLLLLLLEQQAVAQNALPQAEVALLVKVLS